MTPSAGTLWMPGPGLIAPVSLNTLSSIDPCPARNCNYSGVSGQGALFAWSGVTYAPTLGDFGSLIAFGGGHDDYKGNEVYRYDIAARVWNRLTNPYSAWVTGPSGRVSDQATGEYYASEDGTVAGAPGDRQPFQNHTYDSTVFVPGSVAGNTNGKIAKCYSQWHIQSIGKQNHWFDLDTNKWDRMGSGPATNTLFSFLPACYDDTRQRLIKISTSGPSGTLFQLPLTGTNVWTPFGAGRNAPGDGNLDYSARHDAFIRTQAGSGLFSLSLRVAADPQTAFVPTLLGSGPTIAGGGEWIEEKNAFYFYDGQNGKTVYKLTPPRNAFTDPWRWTSETLNGGGASIPGQGPMQHYSRFRYVPPLDAFFWVPYSNTAPVYCFKPAKIL